MAWSPDGRTIATGCHDGNVLTLVARGAASPDGWPLGRERAGRLGQLQRRLAAARVRHNVQRAVGRRGDHRRGRRPRHGPVHGPPQHRDVRQPERRPEAGGQWRPPGRESLLEPRHGRADPQDGSPRRRRVGRGLEQVGDDDRLWKHARGEPVRRRREARTDLRPGPPGYADAARESFTKATLVAGSIQLAPAAGNAVDVWSDKEKLSTLQQISDYDTQHNRLHCFSLMSKQRAIVGSDWSMHLYDIRTGQHLRDLQGHMGPVWAISPSPDGRTFLSASSDQTVNLWSPDRDNPLLTFFFAGDEWVVWSPEGYYAASAGGERLMGWHVNNGLRPRRQLSSPPRSSARRSTGPTSSSSSPARAASKRRSRSPGHGENKVIAEVLPPAVVISSRRDARPGPSTSRRSPSGPSPARWARTPSPPCRSVLDGRPSAARAVRSRSPRPGRRSPARVPADAHPGADAPDHRPGRQPGELRDVAARRRDLQGRAAVEATSSGPRCTSSPWASPTTPKRPEAQLCGQRHRGRSKRPSSRNSGDLFQKVETKLIVDDDASRAGMLGGLTWLKKQMTQHDIGVVFFFGPRRQGRHRQLLPAPLRRRPRKPGGERRLRCADQGRAARDSRAAADHAGRLPRRRRWMATSERTPSP